MAVISSWSTSLPLLLLLQPVAALNSISFSPLITSHTHTNDRASAVTICPHDTTQLCLGSQHDAGRSPGSGAGSYRSIYAARARAAVTGYRSTGRRWCVAAFT